MTTQNEPTMLDNAGAPLVINAMCCLIAADGRISGSEITVVFDALAAIGLRQTPDGFRELVIKTCKEIHRKGVFAVADSLCESLAVLDEPLARLLIQLQDDVIQSDGRVTASEKVIAEKFLAALTSRAVVPPPLPETHPTNSPDLAAVGVLDCPAGSGKLTPLEAAALQILSARKWIDENMGSRAYIVFCASVVAGSIAVFATGSLSAVPTGALLGCAVTAAVFFLGSDNRLRAIAVDAPRRRAVEAALDVQAATLAATLQVPPAVDTTEISVSDVSESEDGHIEAEGERKGFETTLCLVANPSWPTPYRVKLARRVFAVLRGSKQRGIDRSACRCTSCGRKYWFVLFGGNGNGVICPYCGAYQRATLDWKPGLPPPSPIVAASSFWSRPASVPSHVGGPVHVRGYVNKRGKWVNSHTRARPRRRRW